MVTFVAVVVVMVVVGVTAVVVINVDATRSEDLLARLPRSGQGLDRGLETCVRRAFSPGTCASGG